MNKRRIISSVAAFLGIGFFLFAGIKNLYSEEGKAGETGDAAPAEKKAEELADRSVFISIPEIFKDLKRPPVKFNHDKHSRALEKEGCDKCHPRDNKEKLVFEFPKGREDKDQEDLMNLYHETCMGCHNERMEQGESAGAVTCGECHVIEEDYHKKDYLPIMPSYYEPLRDTYHRDCISCHQDPAKAVEEAGALDWAGFYMKEKEQMMLDWPKVYFDHFLHEKHEKALDNKCENCHYVFLMSAANSCQDWLMEIPEGQSLTERKTAHARCINCHIELRDEKKKAGPVNCNECHTGTWRTVEEMADVPRLKCEQKEKFIIQIEEGARMDGVPFNHKLHEESTVSCQTCHHDTMKTCDSCHALQGIEEGGFVTLAEAYHEPSSQWSCIGCHESEKKRSQCAGCHKHMRGGLVDGSCISCHSGSLDSLEKSRKIDSPENIFPEDLKDDMEITVLEKEYKLSRFPHLAIVKKLNNILSDSRLARYFHKDETTICSGCHHYSPVEAKKKVPLCSTCHTVRKELQKAVPTLLGAYHQQCLGCHREMGEKEEKMPQACNGCHEEKISEQAKTGL